MIYWKVNLEYLQHYTSSLIQIEGFSDTRRPDVLNPRNMVNIDMSTLDSLSIYLRNSLNKLLGLRINYKLGLGDSFDW